MREGHNNTEWFRGEDVTTDISALSHMYGCRHAVVITLLDDP